MPYPDKNMYSLTPKSGYMGLNTGTNTLDDMTGGFGLPVSNVGVSAPSNALYNPNLMNYSVNPALLEPGYGSPTTMMGQFSNWMKDSGFLGSKSADGTQTQGWGGLAFGAAQGLGSLYMGMKQYGLGQRQLAFQQDSFNKNFEVQKQLTNSQLEDRQRSRVASNSGAYQSVGDYMKQNGVA